MKHFLVLIIWWFTLLTVLPAYGAISVVAYLDGTSTPISLPAGWQDEDLAILYAYRGVSNTAASLPTGWTSLQGSAGTDTNSLRVAYRVLQTGDTTFAITGTSITWEVLVVRGQHSSTPIGGNSVNSGGSGNAITYPTLTLTESGGSSMIVAGAGHRSATNVHSAVVTGMTNHSNGQANTGMSLHTKVNVTSWIATPFDAVVNQSSGWRAHSVEILAAPVAGNRDITGYIQSLMTGIPSTGIQAIETGVVR